MAGRIQNRRELRKAAEGAEKLKTAADAGAVAEAPKKKTRAKPAGPPKVRKPRAKKAPPRMRARWGIFNSSSKQVAVFEYNQGDAAKDNLAELLGKNKGLYYLQIVKEPMPEPAPLETTVPA